MTLKFHPVEDRILIRRPPPEQKTKGGIIIPETAKQPPPVMAEVLDVGPGKVADDGRIIRPDYKSGDQIMVGPYVGIDIEIEGEKLVLVKPGDIVGRWT